MFFSMRSGVDTTSFEYKAVRSSIHRATHSDDIRNGIHEACLEITKHLQKQPCLIPNTVAMIKADIKDPRHGTSCLAFDLLDQLMSAMNSDFRVSVAKKLLSRILKLSLPNKGIHPQVQKKAASMIRKWADEFGSDPNMIAFANAARELMKKENGPPTLASPDLQKADLSNMPPQNLVALARASQASIMRQIQGTNDAAKIKQLLVLYHQLSADVNAHYARRSRGSVTEKNLIQRAASESELSAMTTPEVLALAQASQASIMQQIQATDDPQRAHELSALYNQLTADLDDFWARSSSVP